MRCSNPVWKYLLLGMYFYPLYSMHIALLPGCGQCLHSQAKVYLLQLGESWTARGALPEACWLGTTSYSSDPFSLPGLVLCHLRPI